MIIKYLIIIVFFLILFSLGSALFYLVKNKGQSTQVARALTFRIGLSLALFILILVLFLTGHISPHGING